jgi:hypothetical protein
MNCAESTSTPKTDKYKELCELILAEEARVQRRASRVRISIRAVTELCGMEGKDWYAAFRGWAKWEDCQKLADEILGEQGVWALNGKKIFLGRQIEITKDLSEPRVTIIDNVS